VARLRRPSLPQLLQMAQRQHAQLQRMEPQLCSLHELLQLLCWRCEVEHSHALHARAAAGDLFAAAAAAAAALETDASLLLVLHCCELLPRPCAPGAAAWLGWRRNDSHLFAG